MDEKEARTRRRRAGRGVAKDLSFSDMNSMNEGALE